MTLQIKPNICAECEGSGTLFSNEIAKCPICNGAKTYLGQPCLGCGGTGQAGIEREDICPSCDGAGQTHGPVRGRAMRIFERDTLR
jgi:DnaJ-class molecular chaperone